jgi:hypothetical protein
MSKLTPGNGKFKTTKREQQHFGAKIVVRPYDDGYRVVVGAGPAAEGAAAAGAGMTSSDGLIQQASTRPFKLSGVLGSMVLECKTRQRNAAWM